MEYTGMDLDTAMSYLGKFGKYQALQFSLHILASLTSAIHMFSLLIVAGVPEHRCNVDVSLAFGNCHYFDRNTNSTVACKSWIYNMTYFKSSRAVEWNFVCSRRWMGAAAQSAYMFGAFVGAITLGNLSDRYGRKTIFYISGVMQLIFGVSIAFVNEYYTFLVMRYFYGVIGSAGAHLTGFVLSMELVGASKRTVCGVLHQVAFAVGFMIVAGWGSIIEESFWLQIVYGLHSAALIPHWWIMDESPRWLWAQGRFQEALEIIEKGLKINGSDLQVHFKASDIREVHEVSAYNKGSDSSGTMDLFKTQNMRRNMLIVSFSWFANAIVYFGLSFSTLKLNGNPFLSIFLMGLFDLPGYLFDILTVEKTGRRSLISVLMLIGGASCILLASGPSLLSESKSLLLFAKTCIAGSYAIIFNYTAELFPTVLRSTAVGVTSMCARFGGAITPLLLLLDDFDLSVPTMIYGFSAILAGSLALLLPETLNKRLPETLEDGENLGKNGHFLKSCFSGNAESGNQDQDAEL